MSVRDAVEAVIREWNQHELDRGAAAVIDYDFRPLAAVEPIKPADRLTTLRRLSELRDESTEPLIVQRIDADLAYLRALMGERAQLVDYIRATQGCSAFGWTADYVTAREQIARECLDGQCVAWGPDTMEDLAAAEGPLDDDNASDAIRSAVAEYENAVRAATGSQATYHLSIETAEIDAYWAYWLDGAGDRVRLRLNTRRADYTKVRARQFALHEVLGHGLQSASIAERCGSEDVDWVRLLSVHGPQQVLFEGWAQAMPLFITPDDPQLVTRVRIDHYTQLVRAELHLSLNSGESVEACAEHARCRVPWWNDNDIANILADRSVDPQLRSYMWAYAAGIDWFTHLATAPRAIIDAVLRQAYRTPLTPNQLEQLWLEGPAVGGEATPSKPQRR